MMILQHLAPGRVVAGLALVGPALQQQARVIGGEEREQGSCLGFAVAEQSMGV